MQSEFRGIIARLDLPTPPDAEYFFRLWFYEGGERQIGARLIQDRSDDTYFWYRPLEMAEFRGSEDDLVSEFCEELKALLTHETRIVQRKGWLFWHFRCEYREGYSRRLGLLRSRSNLDGHAKALIVPIPMFVPEDMLFEH